MNRQSVLITGGTRNTGKVIAETFAQKGYDVHITGRNQAEADTVAQYLKKKYPESSVYAYQLQLSDVGNIKSIFAKVKENSGKLNVFIANAAHLGLDVDIYNADEQMFDEIINTNVKGNFFCCQAAAGLMKDNGGSIVLLSSVQSKGAVEGRTVYGISKAALNAMGKMLAFDLAPYSIRVNTLIVGAIHTERWDVISEEIADSRRSAYPLGKEAEMKDIANATLYLAEDTSKAVTGTEIVIDSGVLLPILPYKERKNFKREGFGL